MVKNILILVISLSITLSANVGKIVALKGELSIQRDNQEIIGELGSIIFKNDQIKTKDNSKTQLLFKDNTVVTIGKNSIFKVNEYIFDEVDKEYKTNFGLLKGTFRTITGKIGKLAPNKFKLNSKTSSIGIRGTQILSRMAISGDRIACIEGEIIITHLKTGQTIIIKAGEFVDLSADTKILKLQKSTVKDTEEMDENTRFTLKDEREIQIENLDISVRAENVAWDEWNEEADDNEALFPQANNNGLDTANNSTDPNAITNPNVIINATHTATYTGKITGTYTEKDSVAPDVNHTIINNSNNLFQATLNFGTNQITNGRIKAQYKLSGATFDIQDISGTIKSDGSGFNLSNGTNWNGSGSGKFYGPEGKTIKGDYSYTDQQSAYGDEVNGNFEATSN